MALSGENPVFLGEINADNINVRNDATVNSKVICTLKKGDRVTVISESYDWYKIRLPKKAALYIKADFAECTKYQEVAPADRNTCLKARVLSNRVNIRTSPDDSGAIVGVADKDEIVDVKGKTQGWFRIDPTPKSFAWVHKKFLNKTTVKEPLVQKIKEREEMPLPAEDIILKGRITPYGIVFKRVATHKLITPDNKIFLLKGDKAALNALSRSKVKVAGKIISPFGAKYPVVEVSAIEVSD
jgi:uncharacterized protein YgiM (DUF1202 family)